MSALRGVSIILDRIGALCAGFARDKIGIAVLLLTAGALFRVASTLVERIVPARAKDPALTMAEIKKLEAIRKAQLAAP